MKGESVRRVPAEKAATPAEIAAAIEGLSDADLMRLRQYAYGRVRRLGRKAGTETGDDLLQAAISDLLDDTRRWDKTKVGFMGFLFGAMKSISSNWAKAYIPEDEPLRDSDLKRDQQDGLSKRAPFDQVASTRANIEEELRCRQTIKEIDELFKDDQDAQMVLTAWQEGYDPAGVRQLWDLSQNNYNTIVRRIRRTIAGAGITPDRDRGGAYVQ